MIDLKELAIACLFAVGVLAAVIFAALASHKHIKRTREMKEALLQQQQEDKKNDSKS